MDGGREHLHRYSGLLLTTLHLELFLLELSGMQGTLCSRSTLSWLYYVTPLILLPSTPCVGLGKCYSLLWPLVLIHFPSCSWCMRFSFWISHVRNCLHTYSLSHLYMLEVLSLGHILTTSISLNCSWRTNNRVMNEKKNLLVMRSFLSLDCFGFSPGCAWSPVPGLGNHSILLERRKLYVLIFFCCCSLTHPVMLGFFSLALHSELTPGRLMIIWYARDPCWIGHV